MATTTNRTATTTNTHATTTTHASPEPGKFDQYTDYIKNHLFEIGLILAGVATGLALQANGFRGVFVYDDAMGVIISIFNAVIMTYPLILAIKSRQWLRIGIIAASVIFTILVLPIEMRILGTFGAALWAIPVLGPIILPLAALFFHIAAAYLLADYGPEGPKVVAEDAGRISGLEANIVSAETDFSKANISAVAHADAEGKAKKKFEKLDKKSKARADEYKSAKKAYDESTAVVKESELKTKLATNENSQKEIQSGMDSKGLEIKRATAPNIKALLQAQLDELDTQLGMVLSEGNTLKADLDNVKTEVDTSPEKHTKDTTFAASETASKVTLTAQEAFEAATKSSKKADSKLGIKSQTLVKSKEELSDITTRIEEAKKSQRGKWRDVAALPVFALVCAFGLYPVWYGWVLITFR